MCDYTAAETRLDISSVGLGWGKRHYLMLTPNRQGFTQGQWPGGRLKWGLGEGGRARTEAGDYDASSPPQGGPAKFAFSGQSLLANQQDADCISAEE